MTLSVGVIIKFLQTVCSIVVTVSVGFLGVRLDLLPPPLMGGLGRTLGNIALPALLFKLLATLDFTKVNIAFLIGVLISKVLAMVIVSSISYLSAVREPAKKRLICAGMRSISATQSNDFALGLPIAAALYGATHPEFAALIAVIAPISLVIINPICFAMCEYGFALPDDPVDEDVEASSSGLVSPGQLELKPLGQSGTAARPSMTARVSIAQAKPGIPFGLIAKQVFSNPIVIFTFLGLIMNGILTGAKSKLPDLVLAILTGFANIFPAGSLIMLGVNMANMGRNVDVEVLWPAALVSVMKLVILPVMQYLFVSLLGGSADLSTFAFIIGAIPTAPIVGLYAVRYTTPSSYSYTSEASIGAILCTVIGVFVLIVLVISTQLLDTATTSTTLYELITITQYYLYLASIVGLAWVGLAFTVDGLPKHPKYVDLFVLMLFTMLRALTVVVCVVYPLSRLLETVFIFIGVFGSTLVAGNLSYLVWEHSRVRRWVPNMNRTAQILSMSGMVVYVIIAVMILPPQFFVQTLNTCNPELWRSSTFVIFPTFLVCYAGSQQLLNWVRQRENEMYAKELEERKQRKLETSNPLATIKAASPSPVDKSESVDEPTAFERTLFDNERVDVVSKRLMTVIVYVLGSMFITIVRCFLTIIGRSNALILFVDTAVCAFQGVFIFIVYGIDTRFKIVRILGDQGRAIYRYFLTKQEEMNRGLHLTSYDEFYTGEQLEI